MAENKAEASASIPPKYLSSNFATGLNMAGKFLQYKVFQPHKHPKARIEEAETDLSKTNEMVSSKIAQGLLRPEEVEAYRNSRIEWKDNRDFFEQTHRDNSSSVFEIERSARQLKKNTQKMKRLGLQTSLTADERDIDCRLLHVPRILNPDGTCKICLPDGPYKLSRTVDALIERDVPALTVRGSNSNMIILPNGAARGSGHATLLTPAVPESNLSGFALVRESVLFRATFDSAERTSCLRKFDVSMRIEVLKTLLEWIATVDRGSAVHWLYGEEGVGKTLVAHYFAMQCARSDALAAGFFFANSENADNQTFIATITHEIARFMGECFRQNLDHIIRRDPSILKRNMRTHLLDLIVPSFNSLDKRSKKPLLIVVDGLDRYRSSTNRREILEFITLSVEKLPICFLICSRRERWIEQEFSRGCLQSITQRTQIERLPMQLTRRDLVHSYPMIATAAEEPSYVALYTSIQNSGDIASREFGNDE